MSDSMAHLRRKISTAGDLQSVVRTMKAMAASSVTQYERSVLALHDYYKTIELALSASFRKSDSPPVVGHFASPPESVIVSAIVFGSDQGLVGQFNDMIADYAIEILAGIPGKHEVWAVGERVQNHLGDAGFPIAGQFAVPSSVSAIAPLVGRILVKAESRPAGKAIGELHLYYNRPASGARYAPVTQRLLPLDASWQKGVLALKWPTVALPEVLGDTVQTLKALIREYLFVSLFRACAESLASENASRLAAMQRADRNIDDLLETLNGSFHRLRQAGIDEELFDVTAGFDALRTDQA